MERAHGREDFSGILGKKRCDLSDLRDEHDRSLRHCEHMIYITGATGRLGQEVLGLLPNAIPLVRTKSGLKNEIVTDFSIEQLKQILKDADCIIHLAGSMNFLDPKELQVANVELTRKIVDGMSAKCRIVFASSISVYGKLIKKVPADEDTPTNPDSPYAKSKLDAEEIVRGRKDCEHVILRIATIYGKGYEDYYDILKQIKKGGMYVIGHGQNRVPFVHVADVADAIKNAIDRKKAKQGVYVLAGDAVKQEEILRISADLLGVSAPINRAPLDAALMFAQFEESKAFLMKSKPKITTEHVLVLASDRPFDCSKAKKMLGFKPRHIAEGIKEIVEDGRARGIF